jgi:hypothetical protein
MIKSSIPGTHIMPRKLTGKALRDDISFVVIKRHV